jgi:hypothetical protein
MKGIELLETYPKAAGVIKEFYNNKLINSMNDSSERVSEEFKEMLKQQSFDNEYVATFIDSNPRFLFDVFDDNEIYINVTAFPNSLFHYSIVGEIAEVGSTETFNTRLEAEKLVVEQAFEILNEKLCQIK